MPPYEGFTLAGVARDVGGAGDVACSRGVIGDFVPWVHLVGVVRRGSEIPSLPEGCIELGNVFFFIGGLADFGSSFTWGGIVRISFPVFSRSGVKAPSFSMAVVPPAISEVH